MVSRHKERRSWASLLGHLLFHLSSLIPRGSSPLRQTWGQIGTDSKTRTAFPAYSPCNPTSARHLCKQGGRIGKASSPQSQAHCGSSICVCWMNEHHSWSLGWVPASCESWPGSFTLLKFCQKDILIQLGNQYPKNIRVMLAMLFLFKVIILWHFNAWKWHTNNSNEKQPPKINKQIDVTEYRIHKEAQKVTP